MVWGGICVRGVTRLKLIVGKMDSSAYKSILQHNVLPDGVRLLGKGFFLQQDNDPKHKEKRVMRYLNNTQNYDNFSIFFLRISIICNKQIYYWSITFFRIFPRHHNEHDLATPKS